jgi:hypothetical protein
MADAIPLTAARVVGRLCIAFMLDMVAAGPPGQGFIDGVITLTIVQANLAPVMRNAALQRAYATYEQAPPDELRRPVSVNAIAASLRLPYETVRRRVAHLASTGVCIITPQGVYVPAAVLNSPEHRAMIERRYELVRALYYRLRDLEVLRPLPAPPPPLPSTGSNDTTPLRAVSRLAGEYFLRIIEAVRLYAGDTISGLVILGVVRANTEHLSDDVRGVEGLDAGSFVPDELRKPVRISTLSTRLAVPHETVRRHAVRLVETGDCIRVYPGLVVPSVVLARPHLMGLVMDNVGHLQRMFAALAQLGVVAEWDAQRPVLGVNVRQSAAPATIHPN